MTAPYDDDDIEEKQNPAESEFARMLEDSFKGSAKKRFTVGDKVRGEILVVGKEEVFVSTGGQSEGIVPRRDLLNKVGEFTHVKGDKLDLFVTQVRGSEVYLSPNPSAKNMMNDLEDAFDMMLPVEGRVSELVKGGFRVALKGGKLGFCPISQLDSRRIETGEEYIGQKFDFMITKFEEGGRNIVLSRRKILDDQKELHAGSFLEEHKEGDIVSGRIMRLEKFGAFVEVAPGIEGLAHVSELAWSRVNDPAEVVSVGQEMRVKILKVEQPPGARMKVSLSIKQAGAQPWDNIPMHVQEGAVVEGKVTRCAKFGAFVELAPGLEGLIPLSEMSHTKRVMRSDELVKEGELVTVKIKEIDTDARRIGLSLKDAGEDPWAMATTNYPVSSIHKGKVTRREAYGLFVQIDGTITGLMPKSKGIEANDFKYDKLKIGDEVVVQVAEVKPEERRISLQPPGDASEGDWQGYQAKQAPAASGSFGTLADKFKLAMEKKKK